ncbi:hypothetical protein JTB14_010057 [Gonioctena quinquepunctata]|nr:hypothetical protein JTB14_010057 [Gonioctena quinquepunctata]
MIKSTRNGRKIPYWWNESINEKRKDCKRYSGRRAITRAASNEAPDAEELNRKYKDLGKELRSLISKIKREHWKNVCKELENDI